MGGFFVFGAAMAAYAAVTLGMPGTFLDALWILNKRGHAGLAAIGRGTALLFVALSLVLVVTAIGWFRRQLWGWVLGIYIIAINALGDIVNLVRGEGLKGAAGVIIAGLLLIYLMRPAVRNYFRTDAESGSL